LRLQTEELRSAPVAREETAVFLVTVYALIAKTVAIRAKLVTAAVMLYAQTAEIAMIAVQVRVHCAETIALCAAVLTYVMHAMAARIAGTTGTPGAPNVVRSCYLPTLIIFIGI